MKPKIFIVLALLFSFPAIALAETVEGRIASASSSAIQVTVFDANGNPYPNPLNLQTDGNTQLSGVSSVSALRRGDGVRVGVRQVSGSVWRADSIVKLSGAAAVAQPAPVKSSSGFRDMLGNPMVRGAATGAITGAIASSASGGKAGKGALIGAGVGAAGGLLMDMFNRPQQPSAEPVYTQSDDSRG